MSLYDTTDELEHRLVHEAGELMVVLDSEREYVLHVHDTEFLDETTVQTEGIDEETGEYAKVQFEVTAIEHDSIHKEL